MCIADNFKMELCFRRYIFRHRQAVDIFTRGLFILDLKVKNNKQINYNLLLTKEKQRRTTNKTSSGTQCLR